MQGMSKRYRLYKIFSAINGLIKSVLNDNSAINYMNLYESSIWQKKLVELFFNM